MKNPKPVDLSSISMKFPNSAFGLFRYWTMRHHISDKLIIENETWLIENLKESFCYAISRLQNKEDRHYKLPGWDIGFILGFVEGNLRTRWYHEYIVRNSEDYKLLCGLRAIEGYLKFDALTEIRINKLYNYALHENSNISNIQSEVEQYTLDRTTDHENNVSDRGEILVLVNNLIIKQIKLISEMDDDVGLPINDYFTSMDIQRFIDDNGEM